MVSELADQILRSWIAGVGFLLQARQIPENDSGLPQVWRESGPMIQG